MDKTVGGIVACAVIAVIFVAMWQGWRARGRRQKNLTVRYPWPENRGDVLCAVDVLYVATTYAHQPLNRVTVGGLGFRAQAQLTLRTTGVWLHIPDQPEFFIPSEHIMSVEKSTWTIDRVVEEGGLLVLTWHLPLATLGRGVPTDTAPTHTTVDTYVRVRDPDEQDALMRVFMQRVTMSKNERVQNHG